jgi:hypothetical protein
VSDIVDVFPASMQAYATVGVSIILGIVGIFGYYKRFRGETQHPDVISREVCEWLSKILEVCRSQYSSMKAIEEILISRMHQDEIERAYNRGRDEALDKSSEKVARNLQSHT